MNSYAYPLFSGANCKIMILLRSAAIVHSCVVGAKSSSTYSTSTPARISHHRLALNNFARPRYEHNFAIGSVVILSKIEYLRRIAVKYFFTVIRRKNQFIFHFLDCRVRIGQVGAENEAVGADCFIYVPCAEV